jgi:predicted house-cleaning noncanonical NTP pyrophosphatase (MazG superfamily)
MITDIPKQLTSSTKIKSDVDIAADYEYSRSNYYKLINAGNEAIEEMLELARETQHPRSFEVLGKLIKDISDVNDRLLKMQKAKKELATEEADTPKTGVTNNNLFVGSTTDLQRMLADAAASSEKEIVHDPKE